MDIESNIIEKLCNFGLTRQEAVIYRCLRNNTELSGYEVAKQTGISRSNVYSGLSGLVEKGGAYLLEGVTNKYVAVLINEFCDDFIRIREQDKHYLTENIQIQPEQTEGYITIEGFKNINNKIYHMINKTEKRIYFSASVEIVNVFRKELEIVIKQGIKVVLITDGEIDLKGAFIYIAKKKEKQIRFISDSKFVLTGVFNQDSQDTCLYSGQVNFVNVFKEALRNEIKLIELMKGN